MSKLKIVILLGVIVSVIIFVTGYVGDLREDQAKLLAEADSLSFINESLRLRNVELEGIGEYGTDTVLVTEIDTIIKEDGVIDTVYRRQTDLLDYVTLDTTQTFKWADNEMRVRVKARLFTSEGYAWRNSLSIYPEEWTVAPPKVKTIFKLKPITPRFGMGLLLHNDYAGAFARYSKFSLGFTKKTTGGAFGFYFGYELLSL